MTRLNAQLCLVDLLFCLAILSCSESDAKDNGEDSDTVTDTASDTDSDSSTETDAGTDTDSASDGCAVEQLGPGNYTFRFSFGDLERQYLVHVPERTDPAQAMPLVLNFHGYGMTAVLEEAYSLMDATADAYQFAVAYPEGLSTATDDSESWNAGDCCAFDDQERDDVGFVRAVVEDLKAKICIDARRIYATGFSNGGLMSHYLACYAADLFAAVASVAGVLGISNEECAPSRPISVIHFHGTADPKIPYDGGELRSVLDTISAWVQMNGCTGDPVETFNNGQARCETHQSCLAGTAVTLCTVEGMGHCWPGQILCTYPPSTTDISASEEIWNFLKDFTLP